MYFLFFDVVQKIFFFATPRFSGVEEDFLVSRLREFVWVCRKITLQIWRTQYAVELETLFMARMEHQSECIASVKTGKECQHTENMSIHGKKSVARKCCLQSLSSAHWLWYGLGNEAREARRASRDVTD